MLGRRHHENEALGEVEEGVSVDTSPGTQPRDARECREGHDHKAESRHLCGGDDAGQTKGYDCESHELPAPAKGKNAVAHLAEEGRGLESGPHPALSGHDGG